MFECRSDLYSIARWRETAIFLQVLRGYGRHAHNLVNVPLGHAVSIPDTMTVTSTIIPQKDSHQFTL